MSRTSTPFHTDVLTPAAPQLKPICAHARRERSRLEARGTAGGRRPAALRALVCAAPRAALPMGRYRLLDEVLLLAPVAGADEGHRDLTRGHGIDVVHRKCSGLVHEAVDRELVGVPCALGHGACERGAQPSDGRGAGEACSGRGAPWLRT